MQLPNGEIYYGKITGVTISAHKDKRLKEIFHDLFIEFNLFVNGKTEEHIFTLSGYNSFSHEELKYNLKKLGFTIDDNKTVEANLLGVKIGAVIDSSNPTFETSNIFPTKKTLERDVWNILHANEPDIYKMGKKYYGKIERVDVHKHDKNQYLISFDCAFNTQGFEKNYFKFIHEEFSSRSELYYYIQSMGFSISDRRKSLTENLQNAPICATLGLQNVETQYLPVIDEFYPLKNQKKEN